MLQKAVKIANKCGPRCRAGVQAKGKSCFIKVTSSLASETLRSQMALLGVTVSETWEERHCSVGNMRETQPINPSA